MNYLDIVHCKQKYTFHGKYYPTLPKVTLTRDESYEDITPTLFEYEVIDPFRYEYRNLLPNLIEKDGADCTIKTITPTTWKNGAYVALYDGTLYQILSHVVDPRETSKQAARLIPIPKGTQHILRLLKVDNPRGFN